VRSLFLPKTAAAAIIAAAVLFFSPLGAQEPSSVIQFVFTSDAHYGITREAFRGATNVDARIVNAALVAKINTISTVSFPRDGGLKSTRPIGPIDFIVEGGDVANRQEITEEGQVQPAAHSWAQFVSDYIEGVTLTTRMGARTPIYVVPGNHEASNAVGYYKPMVPPIDRSAMVEIHNRMMPTAPAKTTATFNYATDKVTYTHDIGGIHFVFLNVWPDSVQRAWLERDLQTVSRTTPVIIFTHDQPDADVKHFTNPNGAHDVNDTDRFENLLSDQLADGRTSDAGDVIEQRAFEVFLRRHPNITAYFHGNSNWNQFYDWTGPDHTIVLHAFRVDSPMKGAISAKDETKLSFQVVTLDPGSRTITVRECLWNADPRHPGAPVTWGGSTTVALSPRPIAPPVRRTNVIPAP
jgi:hypothetical protein